MAHFDFTRPGGIWASPAVVQNAELADLDAKTRASINGDGGGTWSPTSVITIGGSGLAVSTTLTVSGTLNVTGNTVIGDDVSDTLTVNAASEFAGNVSFNSEVTFNSNAIFELSVLFGDAVNVLSTLNVSGVSTLASATIASLTASGAAAFNGPVGLGDGPGDTITIAGTTNIENRVYCTGFGRVTHRSEVGGDSDHTYDPAIVRHVYVPPSTLTLNRVYTVYDANAADDDEITILTDDTGHSIGIKIGTELTPRYSIQNASGQDRAVHLKRILGNWVRLERERVA